MQWHKNLGHPAAKLKFHDHDNLAHYADAAVDIQFEFPFGFRELEGIHSRTDFDLKSHQELSGRKMQYFDPELNENYIPYVLETSIGADRMFLAAMTNALQEENVPASKGNDSVRTVLKLNPAIAPVKCAILPLVKNKPELLEKAKKVFNEVKFDFNTQWDEKDAIGRRYRRQDAIGTPYCITVDFETLDDDMVTIRDRDTLQQERIPIAAISDKVGAKVNMKTLLK
jgi:glycyl-tRNA synthetase